MKKTLPIILIISVVALISSCEKDEVAENNNNPADTTSVPTDTIPTDTITNPPDTAAPKVGFEILRFEGLNMSVWVNKDMTIEEFNALDVSLGWIKNEPRETDPDSGYFSRSPFEPADDMYVEEEHFGYDWLYNAHVVDLSADVPDDDGLFTATMVEKHHTVIFNAGKTISVLTSPMGEQYIRISRDAERTQEIPTIPSAWQLSEYVTQTTRTFVLPNPTLNIRADNEDSWQGPVTL